MRGSTLFQKALLLLDRGRLEEGEQYLREAIACAAEERDDVTLGGALCCIGDLLLETNRPSDGEPFLLRLLALERSDDVLDFEMNRARELLAGISSSEGPTAKG